MRTGDIVSVRDESWRVARAEPFERCTLLTLEGEGAENAGRVFHALAPFDRVAVTTTRPERRKRRTVLRRALGAVRDARPAVGLWTAADATLDLLAYQLEPALAVLRGATRILLADAVGLGKTVQAALILAELRARGLVERALILCPAGLRDIWVTELSHRFGIAAFVLDQTAVAVAMPSLGAGVNPWTMHPVVVASIDFAKRPEVLAAVEAAPVDLLIADEAHHLTPGSDRGAAIDRLASRTPWMVLVSATPHSGDQAAFDYLASIGSLGDPLTTFRRGRRDIGTTTRRRVRFLSVRPTADEDRLLAATDAYARAIWHGRGRDDGAVQLVAITLARRAASSAVALERTLTRRVALLGGAPLDAPVQVQLPWEETDDGDDESVDERLGRPGLLDGIAERRQLDSLIELAQLASTHSSKLRCLCRFLHRCREPVVVFTEYRDTLRAASAALSSTFRVASIHGGVPAALRDEVVRQFDRGEVDVLLATDTAGEGLNLHRRCRLVIDLELPWNPLRIEQRIGRVDRLGQQRPVHALHLYHRGTVEDRVLANLERRRTVASNSLGDAEDATEAAIAEAVFDGASRTASRAADVLSTRVDGAMEESRRINQLRLMQRRPDGAGGRPAFAASRSRRRSAIAVYEHVHLGATGSVVERVVSACRFDLPHARGIRFWTQLAGAACEGGVSAPPDVALLPLRQSVRARIDQARSRLVLESRPVHQGSLFDRRAERTARARAEVIAKVDELLARRAASLAPLPSDRPARGRLVALWPVRL